jgi:hypothetical protein
LNGAASVPVGLYSFGNYIGRLSGYHNGQSVICPNQPQQQAVQQTKYAYQIAKYFAQHPKTAWKVLKYQISNNPYYYVGKGIVTGGIGLIVGPLSGGGLNITTPSISGMSITGNSIMNSLNNLMNP